MSKAKRLRDLRIDEISSVDVGANSGARIMLMKRADATSATVSPAGRRKKPKRPQTVFVHQAAAREQARAARRAAKEKQKMSSKILRKMMKAYKPKKTLGKTLSGDAFDRSVVGHVSRDTPPPMASLAPVEITTEAYETLMKAAREYAGQWDVEMTPEAAFAKAYQDPQFRALVARDKAEHFARATTALRLNGNDGPDREPDADPDIGKRLAEILKADPKLPFEKAATLAIRGKAA